MPIPALLLGLGVGGVVVYGIAKSKPAASGPPPGQSIPNSATAGNENIPSQTQSQVSEPDVGAAGVGVDSRSRDAGVYTRVAVGNGDANPNTNVVIVDDGLGQKAITDATRGPTGRGAQPPPPGRGDALPPAIDVEPISLNGVVHGDAGGMTRTDNIATFRMYGPMAGHIW